MCLLKYVAFLCALSPTLYSHFIFDVEKFFGFLRQNRFKEATSEPELECPGSRLDPVIRSIFHRFHNDLRRNAAKGHYLEYDCHIEEMAESLDVFDNIKGFEINFSEKSTPWDGAMHEIVEEILESWTRTDKLRKMIHVNTTRIGCTYYVVPAKFTLNVICLYDTMPVEDAVLVENDAACLHGCNSTLFSPSACHDSLYSAVTQRSVDRNCSLP
ncbi:hypothetical protein Aduo_016737 [Ancylostoma duodenale]